MKNSEATNVIKLATNVIKLNEITEETKKFVKLVVDDIMKANFIDSEITEDAEVISCNTQKMLEILEKHKINYNSKLYAYMTTQIIESFKQLKKQNELPELLKVSQSHSINTFRHTITGATTKRTSSKIIFSIDEWGDKATATQGRREGFKTEINIHEFGTIKHLLKNDKLSKLLDLVFYNLDKQGYKGYVEFPLTQFIEYIGNKVTKNSKNDITKELKPILKALHNFSISSKAGKHNFAFVRPFSRAEVKQGKIIIGFDEIFVKSIDKSYFMMPKEVGKLKNTAYYMACYMFIYARQANKKAFNLTYETLYEYSGLPRYGEVMEKYDRHITQKIIDPFMKALYQIKEELGDNIEMTEATFEEANWEAFKKAKIKIKLPKLQETVIAIKKKRKEAIQKNKKAK